MVEESTRAALAGILTHQFKGRAPKREGKGIPRPPPPPVKKIEQAYALYFDGAYRRKEGKAAAGMVVFNPAKEKVMEKGIVLLNVSSNNEAEYAALITGLEWCVSNAIQRLNVFGDSMLIVKQVQGIWSCKSDKLAAKLREVRALFRKIKYHQVHYVGRASNQDADALANQSLKEFTVGAVKLQEPKMQGRESLQDVWFFLETGEPSQGLNKGERRWLTTNAVKYQIMNTNLFSQGRDQVLKKVPSQEDIHRILHSCHNDVCGGHFASELTCRKILQARFVWPSLQRDAHF